MPPGPAADSSSAHRSRLPPHPLRRRTLLPPTAGSSRSRLRLSADTGYNTMQQPAQDHNKPTIEMSLREHLLAAGAGQPSTQPLPQHSSPQGPPHAIDPAIAGQAYQMSQGAIDDGNTSEGRSKGRRELSTSKRAAQNRAAQRAFRQRKEEYIKQLKDQVKEFEQLCELYKTLQTENYQLRDYIINLQSRLLETQGEIPPAPAGVDLNRPHGEPANLNPTQPQPPQHPQQSEQQPQPQESSSSNNGGLSERQIGELQMAAQAAAAAQHGPAVGHKHSNSEDSYDYAEKRQKADGSPQGTASSGDYDAFVDEMQQSTKVAA
ncbi:hypothetical protein HBH98_059720 [Parastagonospora nodorum]|nr:hypothetical protein HBI09_053720 [Parastagonospora nodorum]KAH4139463.1 hypothetical protein HBH45_093330 [Parastagonospora nodorum]KAH4202623.1 hypothetical protein HBH42_020590 [Parastagonospora nodorum]KAH4350014.1 hypothetical protein HBH98_059720 [Parastagonospora nodorum]KAH4395084.1 hypothetical protein HBH97_027540 [Parastagonospora nodorum]